MITRSFDKAFEVVDYTQEIVNIPVTYGLVNELGLFAQEPVSQHSVVVESINGTLSLLVDKFRGERNTVNKDDTRQLRAFAIPHMPLDDSISPNDLQGKRAYANPDQPDTEAAVIARKLQRIRQNHEAHIEFSRMFSISTGSVYAPSGTVTENFYTSFGVTRKEIDFVLGTATTELASKISEGIDHIQDNVLDGSVVRDIIVLCSPEFFDRLISHATVKEAYKFYASTQEPLRERLGSGFYERFSYKGVTFIRYRGGYQGQRFIPAGEARMLPQGVNDAFVTLMSPANKFQYANTLGEFMYTFAYRNNTDDAILFQSEHNHLHMLKRPQTVLRLFSSN